MQPLQLDFGDNSFSELKQNGKNIHTSVEWKKYVYICRMKKIYTSVEWKKYVYICRMKKIYIYTSALDDEDWSWK